MYLLVRIVLVAAVVSSSPSSSLLLMGMNYMDVSIVVVLMLDLPTGVLQDMTFYSELVHTPSPLPPKISLLRFSVAWSWYHQPTTSSHLHWAMPFLCS